MTEVWQGPTPHVCSNEVSVKRELAVDIIFVEKMVLWNSVGDDIYCTTHLAQGVSSCS